MAEPHRSLAQLVEHVQRPLVEHLVEQFLMRGADDELRSVLPSGVCHGAWLAPGDLAAQVAQALRNTRLGLGSAGASFDDVVRLTFYVTQWSPEKIAAFMEGVEAVAAAIGLPLPMPPASLIGVDYLFEPDVLVEVEATAIRD